MSSPFLSNFWTKIDNSDHSGSSAPTHCNAMPSDETFSGEKLFPFFRKGCVKICQKACVISDISRFTKTENLEALRFYIWDYAAIILHVKKSICLIFNYVMKKEMIEWKKEIVLWVSRNWSTSYKWSNFEFIGKSN